jgi:hypothetical protein
MSNDKTSGNNEFKSNDLVPVTGESEPDISFTIAFLETVDVRIKTGEDDSNISLSITFLETVDVCVKTGKDASDISLSIFWF